MYVSLVISRWLYLAGYMSLVTDGLVAGVARTCVYPLVVGNLSVGATDGW